MRSEQPEEPCGPVRRSKCLRPARGAFRAAQSTQVAASRAGWARWGEGQWGDNRETSNPAAKVPLCLPPAEPPGVEVCVGWWVAGRWSWSPGKRGFEQLWGMILFPEGHRWDLTLALRLFLLAQPALNSVVGPTMSLPQLLDSRPECV